MENENEEKKKKCGERNWIEFVFGVFLQLLEGCVVVIAIAAAAAGCCDDERWCMMICDISGGNIIYTYRNDNDKLYNFFFLYSLLSPPPFILTKLNWIEN